MANFNKIVIVTLLACIVGKVYAAATVQGLSGSVPIKGAELTTLITAYSEKSSQTGMKPAGYPMKVKAPDNDNTRAWGIAGMFSYIYDSPVAVGGCCVFLLLVDALTNTPCITTNIKQFL